MKSCTDFCTQLVYGHHVWKSCMASLYGNLVRMSRVEIMYEIHVRTHVGKMLYGSVVWKCCMDVWKSCVDILNEHFVWKSCMEVMCGNPVWNLCRNLGC